jgi:hypothetical protein
MLRRLNCGRLYFLLGMVEKSDYADYYYVKKSQNGDIIYSPYDCQPLNSEDVIMEKLDPLFQQLIKNHNIQERHGYYITNILTGVLSYLFRFYLEWIIS